MKVLSFDPSGNFNEGNGTTGWAYFEDGELKHFGDIKAKDYSTPEEYWHQHLILLGGAVPDVVIYENYKLQAGKAQAQSWSELETPQLIGVIRWACFNNSWKCVEQSPSIKPRFADSVLEKTGVIEKKGRSYHCLGKKTNLHIRDAIRHGKYYLKYGK